MRSSTQPLTIFEYIAEKVVSIEIGFSELNNFASPEGHLRYVYFDKQAHRFKPLAEREKFNFNNELKAAIEDLAEHAKKTFVHLIPLLKELNREESKKINQMFHRLIRIIENCHHHVAAYIEKTNLPHVVKSGLLYLAETMKQTINECEIIEIELFNDDIIANAPPLLEAPSPIDASIDANALDKLLIEITTDVDQVLGRLPFSTSSEERKKIIEERLKEHLKEQGKCVS